MLVSSVEAFLSLACIRSDVARAFCELHISRGKLRS
jgi:hypothetical protein